jgi:hypothetical protein
MGATATTDRNQASLDERQPLRHAGPSRGAYPLSFPDVTHRPDRLLERQVMTLGFSRHAPQNIKRQVEILRRRIVAARLAGA